MNKRIQVYLKRVLVFFILPIIIVCGLVFWFLLISFATWQWQWNIYDMSEVYAALRLSLAINFVYSFSIWFGEN